MEIKEVTIFNNVQEFENFILNEVKEKDMTDFFREPVGTLFWDQHISGRPDNHSKEFYVEYIKNLALKNENHLSVSDYLFLMETLETGGFKIRTYPFILITKQFLIDNGKFNHEKLSD